MTSFRSLKDPTLSGRADNVVDRILSFLIIRYDVPGSAMVRDRADPETKSSSPDTERRKTPAMTLWTAGFTQL
jgi:hypothetical protein